MENLGPHGYRSGNGGLFRLAPALSCSIKIKQFTILGNTVPSEDVGAVQSVNDVFIY